MAVGIVNIGKDARGDMFHRYKMPVLQVKVEGKGNGIKTVIPNMSDIARALARPQTYITKFFGCELGAQTTFEQKVDRYIVNGAHQADRLRELLDVFIDKFVLCPSCKNPETELILSRDGLISKDCKACGHRGMVDNRHKLCTFILKNPPDNGSSKKKSKKDKKSKNGDQAETGNHNENGSSDDGNEAQDELTKRIEGEAVDAKTAEATSTLKDDDWSVDTSAEAVKARMKSLEAGVQNGLSLGDDDEDEGAGNGAMTYEALGDWINENRDSVTGAEILVKAKELGIDKKHKTVQIIAQSLFTDDAVKQVAKHQALFVKMVTSEKHQKSLLGGIEKLCGELYPSLVPIGVPKILMEFYQADVLDEEVIKQWGTHVSKKYVDKDTSKKVRRSCEPLLKWLDEAEDED
ncbi:domain found in IF2B/IF5-domain-containing protein [Phakopsora pachyrhizi]|uniref:Domain found in IF2B/IF5-domain-containing protein n=1 Tax=Phakopsora pachyrhizi TaxID=170000 RepID=A0AAV0AI52_PHAPC|nr:domain found in IF2B/IF5-domain-containing protein [Phakopsora pachyrhizi]CAH7667634.1 domain found in IF2B/IF5-domain-containing protein [Phakopsora pachyrhizi]